MRFNTIIYHLVAAYFLGHPVWNSVYIYVTYTPYIAECEKKQHSLVQDRMHS